jgi:Protein of unknown function (DUF1257)
LSKYAEYDIRSIRDQETLLAALAACGYSQGKVEVHQQPVTLYDYVGKARPEKAHVIIRRNNTGIGASNDIGFLKQSDGTFKAIVSDWDTTQLHVHGKRFVEAVAESYGKLTADRAIKTVLTRTIPALKLQGKIPAHATVKQEIVGETTRLVVRY